MDLASPAGERPAAFWQALGRQLAEPRGGAGRALAWMMDHTNAGAVAATLEIIEAWRPRNIIEIGFGSGRATRALLARMPESRVCGIDRSADMLKMARRMNAQAIAGDRLELVRGTADGLPWPSSSFDCAVGINVAYFFGTEGREMHEIHRVLSPGGRVALYATAKSSMARWPFASELTHRTYDAGEFEELVRRSGLIDVEVRHTDLPLGVRGMIATGVKSDCGC